ncbi:MAG: archaeal heat shock protein Hsp20 [Candidatus Ranarchaeia archaeon]
MSWWDPDDDRKKKDRRFPWWNDDLFDIDKIQDMIRDFMKAMGPNKEGINPDWTKELEKQGIRPFVWGFSASTDQDGKIHFRPFGNVQADPQGNTEIKESREPLVDVTEEENEIVVIIELPGVTREDIELNSTENQLTVKVETEYRKYYKDVKLPSEVVAESAKARYKNGVLEIRLKKIETDKKEGKKISID